VLEIRGGARPILGTLPAAVVYKSCDSAHGSRLPTARSARPKGSDSERANLADQEARFGYGSYTGVRMTDSMCDDRLSVGGQLGKICSVERMRLGPLFTRAR
jgi:hypothetical protein